VGDVSAAQEEDAAQAAIRAIWEQHRTGVLERLDVLDRAVTALMTGSLDEELRAEAEREAHKVAGSVGTFGFARASERARELELALAGPASPGQERLPALAELVVSLRQELEEQPGPPAAQAGDPVPLAARVGEEGPLLLVVDDDRALAERLAAEAETSSMLVEVADAPDAALAFVEQTPPDVALVDLGFPEGHGDPMALLDSLAEAEVPTLVFTVSEAFVDRVEAARRGAQGFLSKSLSAREVVAAASSALERRRATAFKLLAVDDDPTILESLKALLEPEGLTVATISRPDGLWDALEQTDPDLLLLDVDMPQVSGIELCRVVRNDPRWGALPIVFLTARRDPLTVQEVFSAGADDYLNKPIVAPELTMRIRNRLERIRLLRAMADTDALTGVANRRRSVEQIEGLIRMADRYDQPLSLAEVDIDHFKAVNDRFGHSAGDAVLRRMGALLRAAFRGEDVVARWGGEEFVVAMYGLPRENGVERLGEVLETFRALDFGEDGAPVRITFSAGVSHYPEDGEDLGALHRAADGALYLAKAMGRSRVMPAGSAARLTADRVDVVVVEDDDAPAELLEHSLETRGLTVRRFADGAEARTALGGEEPALRARLVLLDVDLPGLDGISVLRGLAGEGVLAATRVIMLTARSGESEVLKALELGAFDHVAKPFSVPVLMQKVRRALAD